MATPTAAAVGAKITATMYNQLVALLTDSGWITATLAGTWVNFGAPYENAQYRILNGVVYLAGVVKSGATTGTILTLPAGYRPLATLRFPLVDGVSSLSINGLEITSAGVVSPVTTLGSVAEIPLNGITFIAEQ